AGCIGLSLACGMPLAVQSGVRSTAAPRIRYDGKVRFAPANADASIDARSVNLSIGGVFVESAFTLEPGAQVDVDVDLTGGGGPVSAHAEVVWVNPESGMAMRFLGLDETSTRRIARLVARRAGESKGELERTVRVRLPGLPAPLRAGARELDDDGVVLEAEL